MIQRKTGALVNMIQRKTGVTDHLDLGGHIQELLQQQVPAEDIEAAVLSFYEATRTELS